MPTAYSYVRWSSDKQTLGDSERRQWEAAQRYAKDHHLTLSDTRYVDSGVSAFKGRNAAEGALRAFLDAVDRGGVPKGAVLIIEAFDRLSRAPVMDALALLQSIVGRGIEVVTLMDGQRYSQATIGTNWAILVIALANMAKGHAESADKSRRVKEAWDAKRRSGVILTAMAPPWLRLSEDRRSWSVVKEQADKVQLIFKLAVEGSGTPTIARRLNADKVKPFLAEDWTNGTVAHVLKNRAVIGTYTPSKVAEPPVEGYYPAILDESTFWAAQHAMTARKWKGSSNQEAVTNLLTGICYCHCGSRMKFVSSTKPNYYLHCVKAYSGAGCTGSRHPYREVRYEGLERYLLMWFHLDEELHYPHVEDGKPSGAATKLVIEGQLKLKQEQLDVMVELMKAGSRRGAHEVLKLEAEVEALQEQLRTYTKPADRQALDTFNDSFLLMQDMNAEADATRRNEQRRAIRSSLQRLIEKVVFLDGVKEADGREWRAVQVKLHGSEKVHHVPYPLPPFGINGTRKRVSSPS